MLCGNQSQHESSPVLTNPGWGCDRSARTASKGAGLCECRYYQPANQNLASSGIGASVSGVDNGFTHMTSSFAVWNGVCDASRHVEKPE
ncbi:hypothetical protein FKM82_026918 [Ascaphus truei]